MQEVSLYNIDQLILCVAESLQELDKVERHTHINHMVKKASINDNLPSSSPSGKTVLIVLSSVLGFIVLGFLYYQIIGI